MSGETRIAEKVTASLVAIALASVGTVAVAQTAGHPEMELSACRIQMTTPSVPVQEEPVVLQATFTESIGEDLSGKVDPESGVEVVEVETSAAGQTEQPAEPGTEPMPGDEPVPGQEPAEPQADPGETYNDPGATGDDANTGNDPMQSGAAGAAAGAMGGNPAQITLNTKEAVAGQWELVVEGDAGKCTGTLTVEEGAAGAEQLPEN